MHTFQKSDAVETVNTAHTQGVATEIKAQQSVGCQLPPMLSCTNSEQQDSGGNNGLFRGRIKHLS